jgi:predicted DNA-binding transcriptional regulator AlpA
MPASSEAGAALMSALAHIPYPSRASMARLLDCAESTIDELVKRGVLPPPIKFSAGMVRWDWAEVQVSINDRKAGTSTVVADPFVLGLQNVTTVKTGTRNG